MFVAYTDSDEILGFRYVLSSFPFPSEEYEIYGVNEKIVRWILTWDAAVDPHNQLIYAFNYTPSLKKSDLVMFDYAGTNMTVLYEGIDFFFIYIDVFNDFIVWVTNDRVGNSMMYICKPSPTCTPDHMITLRKATDVST